MAVGRHFAEVIEANNYEFLSQCYEFEGVPGLGSMVETSGKEGHVYSLVYSASTHSIEPGRRIVARGRDATVPADILKQNPQLAKLMCSDFRALVIGFSEGGKIHQYLPPFPVSIFSFVYNCQPEDVKRFTVSLDFIGLLLDSRLPAEIDEVIAAFIRYAGSMQDNRSGFMLRAGRALALRLSNDTRRLDSILKRISA